MTRIERLLGAQAGSEIEVPLDLIISDDWTTPSLSASLEALGTRRAAAPVVVVHDHTRTPSDYQGEDRDRARQLIAVRDAFARRYGADVIEGHGIQHHAAPLLARLRPGMRVLANDSHAPTLGAYGVAAFAGQPSTVAAGLHTGRIVLRVPRTLRIALTGRLGPGVSARDAALTLLGRLRDGSDAPLRSVGVALEFGGPGVAGLSLAERAVLANIAPEAVAVTSTFPIDRRSASELGTLRDVASKLELEPERDPLDPRTAAEQAAAEQAAAEQAVAAADLVLDLSTVDPSVARGPDPGDVAALSELTRTAVDRVFVGTCAGGTYEEIVAFAAELRGPVAVPTQLTPASATVELRLREEGVFDRLASASVELLPPGCGACFGFGAARLEPGQIAVSTGPRNGRGRMGSPQATIHLASGRTAGIAARTGSIGTGSSPRSARPRRGPTVSWPQRGNVIRLRGVVTTDDLTPSSVPGVGTSHDGDPRVLRSLLLRHLDASAERRDLRGTVIVADRAFGMGSNRASSVRALQVAGVLAVIARSVAPLYAWGARDEGFPVLELDDDAFHDAATPDATVVLDRSAGLVRIGERSFTVARATEWERAVQAAGGLVGYLRAGDEAARAS